MIGIEDEVAICKKRFSSIPYGTEPGVAGENSHGADETKSKQGQGKRAKVIVEVAGGLTADLTPGKHEVGKPD